MELKDIYHLPSCGGISECIEEEEEKAKEQDNLQLKPP